MVHSIRPSVGAPLLPVRLAVTSSGEHFAHAVSKGLRHCVTLEERDLRNLQRVVRLASGLSDPRCDDDRYGVEASIALRIGVDAQDLPQLHFQDAGLFLELSNDCCAQGLAPLESPPGQRPLARVGATNEQPPAAVIARSGRDTHHRPAQEMPQDLLDELPGSAGYAHGPQHDAPAGIRPLFRRSPAEACRRVRAVLVGQLSSRAEIAVRHVSNCNSWVPRRGGAPSRGLSRGRLLAGLSWVLVVACIERGDPPGAARPNAAASAESFVGSKEWELELVESGAIRPTGSDAAPGTLEDALPFEPEGTRIGSIAWRTWVYTDVGPQRTRYGYLRAGAIVDARGPAITNEGCAGGWYRINPRGFVCVGRGATLDVEHPTVTASAVRAGRGEGLPYLYGKVGDKTPYLYHKVPSPPQARELEGASVFAKAEAWRYRVEQSGLATIIGEIGEQPSFLEVGTLDLKPYGVSRRLAYQLHTGKANPNSGFAIARVFERDARVYGLTTELDIVALDSIDVVRPSRFHGAELSEGESLPVAFIDRDYAPKLRLRDDGQLVPVGNYGSREVVKLTGETRAGGFHRTQDGYYLVGSVARIVEPRVEFPSFATGSRKWIDISIREQSLVAYVGRRPVYVTLVSSGRGGMGDPEEVQATVRGTFMIHSKHVSATMDGEEDKTDSFFLLDVPFVQYFHRGYALHGAYWHDEFGEVRSHGCVNLAPLDAAWLFEWTDPVVPEHWHSVLNKKRGTVVHIRG